MVDEDHGSIEEPGEEAALGEPLVINPGDTLDLHTFVPREVPSLLNEFFYLCRKTDIKLVKIIHGKGSASLRRWVHSLLARDQRVVAFRDAPPTSGGWGATLVELRGEEDENSKKV